VSNLEICRAPMATKPKSTRNRPSIGVSSLLDQSSPAASRTIDTARFKLLNLAGKTESMLPLPRPAISQPAVFKDLPERSVIACHAIEYTGIVNKGNFGFDIGQLNLSLGAKRQNPVVPGHIRRVQSNTHPPPAVETLDFNACPTSFHTRLGNTALAPSPQKRLYRSMRSPASRCCGCPRYRWTPS
jgi:hypothetical protein